MAAPATVSGEFRPTMVTGMPGNWIPGRPDGTTTREPGDLPSGVIVCPMDGVSRGRNNPSAVILGPHIDQGLEPNHMTAKISNFRTVLHQDVSARVLPAAFALVFGVFMVWGVGFAQPAEIHNAAHDGRHAFSLPCH